MERKYHSKMLLKVERKLIQEKEEEKEQKLEAGTEVTPQDLYSTHYISIYLLKKLNFLPYIKVL